MIESNLKYGGFWRRLAALLLDVLICLPWGALVLLLQSRSRYFWLYELFPSALFGLFYSVYLVRRFGGTPGKLLAGLCILKVGGTAIGYREAVLRYLPDFLLMLFLGVGTAMAAFQLTDSDYFSESFSALQTRLHQSAPPWYRWVNILNQFWVWGELVVLLTNRKRRALHDFLAGTVVVVRKSARPLEQSAVFGPSQS